MYTERSKYRRMVARLEVLDEMEKAMGPDRTREGIFQTHNCYRCKHGKLPCVEGSPRFCGYPRARND